MFVDFRYKWTQDLLRINECLNLCVDKFRLAEEVYVDHRKDGDQNQRTRKKSERLITCCYCC